MRGKMRKKGTRDARIGREGEKNGRNVLATEKILWKRWWKISNGVISSTSCSENVESMDQRKWFEVEVKFFSPNDVENRFSSLIKFLSWRKHYLTTILNIYSDRILYIVSWWESKEKLSLYQNQCNCRKKNIRKIVVWTRETETERKERSLRKYKNKRTK